MPFKCRSIGRGPIMHPPGNETSAYFFLARSGPRTQIEARIVLTSLYGASAPLYLFGLTITDVPSTWVLTPKNRNIFSIVTTSRKPMGTFLITHVSSVRSVAAKTGNAEFFAPLISTVPLSLVPPLITSLSISSPGDYNPVNSVIILYNLPQFPFPVN